MWLFTVPSLTTRREAISELERPPAIRPYGMGQGDRLGAVRGRTDHLDALHQREHHAQPFADHPLVVGDEHPDHAGTTSSTRNP